MAGKGGRRFGAGQPVSRAAGLREPARGGSIKRSSKSPARNQRGGLSAVKARNSFFFRTSESESRCRISAASSSFSANKYAVGTSSTSAIRCTVP